MINPFVKRSAPVPPGPEQQAKIDSILANSAHAPGGKYYTPPTTKPSEPTPQMVGNTGLTQDKYDGLSRTAQRAINPGAFGEVTPEFDNPYTQRVAGGGSATMPTALAGATVGNVGQSDPVVKEYYAGTNPAVNTQDSFTEPAAPTQQPQSESPQVQPVQVAGDPNDVFTPITDGQPQDQDVFRRAPIEPERAYFPNFGNYNPWDPYAAYDPLTQWQQPRG